MIVERDISHCILEKEDTIAIGAETTLSCMAESELLKKEAKSLYDAASFLCRAGGRDCYAGGAGSIYQEVIQDIHCNLKNHPVPCLKEGGTECFAVWDENHSHSVMGGKKLGSPSCVSACPVGMEIPSILEQLRSQDRLEAQRLIMKYNPMPAVSCQMCRRCDNACVRGTHDHGVAVSGIVKALGKDIAARTQIFYAVPSGDSRKKIAIKGCGPSGASAAFYLRKLGSQVCVIEQKSQQQMLDEYKAVIPDFPVREFADYITALKGMGVEFIFGGNEPEGKADGFDWTLESTCITDASVKRDTVQYFLEGIRKGYEAANKINLEIGLKSYIKPVKSFLEFDRNGMEIHDCVLTYTADGEMPGWEEVAAESARCLNCGCYGVNESCMRAVMTALDAEIKTNRRSIRALDFFGDIAPLKRLEEGEYIQEFEIPKSSDYHSGYLHTDQHIGMAFAYLVQHGKVRDARIVYGGIAPVPYRMIEAEAFLRGKELSRNVGMEAAELIGKNVVLVKADEEKVTEMKMLLTSSLAGLMQF